MPSSEGEIGVAGLGGLFKDCIDCYNLVRRGAAVDKDYRIVETRFNNQEFRLLTWGKACGLVGLTEYEKGLDEPLLRERVATTLKGIADLFEDEKRLEGCGLKVVEDGPSLAVSGLVTAGSTGTQVQLGRSWGTIFAKRNQAPQSPAIRDISAWAISDRVKFSELIQKLKGANDDLDTITSPLQEIARKQKIYIENEVVGIRDPNVLEVMAVASSGDQDAIFRAVSLRLETIRTERIDTGIDSRNKAPYRSALARIPAAVDETTSGGTAVSRPRNKPLRKSYKLLFVGDSDAGIHRLLVSYARGNLPETYMPAVLENYIAEFELDGQRSELELCNTSGREEYDRLRPLSYPGSHAIMLCFRTSNPTAETKTRIGKSWAPELDKYLPGAPVVLVGLSTPEDHNGGNSQSEQAHCSMIRTLVDEHGEGFAPLRRTQDAEALKYFFCDPKTGFGANELFAYAIQAAVNFADQTREQPPRKGFRNKMERFIRFGSRSS